MRPTKRTRLHAGFTLAEILIVIAIVGIMASISMPRLGKLRDKSELSSAMSRFTRGVMAARQAAIQRGKRSFFRHKDNSIWVIVDTTSTDSVIVVSPTSLMSLYGVQVYEPTGLASIGYDPRGVSTQASQQMFRFKHRSNLVDSLCVSRLGNTIRAKCL
jgi:prepilin-type N-terminal cleavage/methylation domain-containing protein